MSPDPNSMEELIRLLEQAKKVEDPKIQVFTITITPELAAELLKFSENIRPTKKSVVKRYENDMRLGLWRLTGATIIFDWDAKGKDGDHRLKSCVESGEPFDAIVVVGVDPVATLSLDIGAKRGLDTFLRHEGHGDAKNLAAAIRLAYQLLDKKVVTQETFSPEVLMRWYRDGEHYGLEEDLKLTRGWEKYLRDLGTGLTRTYMGAIRHAASYVPGLRIEDMDAFFASVAGSGPDEDRFSPEYQLRVFLQKAATTTRSRKTNRIQQPQMVAATIKAWNLYIDGKQAKNVSAIIWHSGGEHPEEFPQISAGSMVDIAEEIDGGGA